MSETTQAQNTLTEQDHLSPDGSMQRVDSVEEAHIMATDSDGSRSLAEDYRRAGAVLIEQYADEPVNGKGVENIESDYKDALDTVSKGKASIADNDRLRALTLAKSSLSDSSQSISRSIEDVTKLVASLEQTANTKEDHAAWRYDQAQEMKAKLGVE